MSLPYITRRLYQLGINVDGGNIELTTAQFMKGQVVNGKPTKAVEITIMFFFTLIKNQYGQNDWGLMILKKRPIPTSGSRCWPTVSTLI